MPKLKLNRYERIGVIMLLILCEFTPAILAQDSLNIKKVGSLYDCWGSAIRIETDDKYAYVLTRETGIRILDISNLNNVREVGKYSFDTRTINFSVVDGIAYVPNENYGFDIVDISNPANPYAKGTINEVGGVVDIVVMDSLIYITTADLNFTAFNISNLENIVEISSLSIPDLSGSFELQNNFAYLACDDSGLVVIDVSDPANMSIVGRNVNHRAFALDIEGDYAYVVDGIGSITSDGFYVYDISNPCNPTEVGHGSTPSIAVYIKASEESVFVSDQDIPNYGSVRMFDVRDPTHPTESAYYQTYQPYGITLKDNLVFVADSEKGVLIFDTSTPDSLELKGKISTPNYISNIKISGNIAYV